MKVYALMLLCTCYVLIFFLFDLIQDYLQPQPFDLHFYLELISVVCLFIIIAYFSKEFYQTWQALKYYRQEIVKLKSSIQNQIQTQFQEWKLTPAESEVALMLIKGFLMKEIASFRNTSQTTIRQQANSIYQKADLQGRNELSGWFIDFLNQDQNS